MKFCQGDDNISWKFYQGDDNISWKFYQGFFVYHCLSVSYGFLEKSINLNKTRFR